MATVFDEKIHSTLGDSRLQLAIYKATGRLMENRKKVVSDDVLPDYQELRQQAHDIKQNAIDNLDWYLEEFERNVQARGGTVHWCRDGQEVADVVLAIAKRRKTGTIIKSKSMATEEIDLNERLEHFGMESVESDLGEYILQLNHEYSRNGSPLRGRPGRKAWTNITRSKTFGSKS